MVERLEMTVRTSIRLSSQDQRLRKFAGEKMPARFTLSTACSRTARVCGSRSLTTGEVRLGPSEPAFAG